METSAAARRVLMICFAYPPVGGVGMIRPAKFAKFLPEAGYIPIVLTPAAGGPARVRCDADVGASPAEVHRTGYRDMVSDVRARLGLRERAAASPDGRAAAPTDAAASGRPAWRRALGAFAYEAITVPDEHAGWKKPALEVAHALLARRRIDIIYSTSPPETAHVIARELKHEFGIPWVADLRDLWSGDHYRQRMAIKRWVLGTIERRVLRDADAIVTVSDRWRQTLASSYESPSRPVVCIPHGFDGDDYARGIEPSGDCFSILYTGSLDRDYQDPEPFLSALGDLVRAGDVDRGRVRVDFHVFGGNLPDFDALADRHGLTDVVRTLAPLEYRACLAAQQAATMLLVLQWQSEAGKGNPPLKVYDYLGARRPILVCGSGEGVLGALVKQTQAGVVGATRNEIADILRSCYRTFVETGRVVSSSTDQSLAPFTRRAQSKKLGDLFNALVA